MSGMSVQIGVRIPEELLAWLRERAAAEHRTLASMIKALLEDARARARRHGGGLSDGR